LYNPGKGDSPRPIWSSSWACSEEDLPFDTAGSDFEDEEFELAAGGVGLLGSPDFRGVPEFSAAIARKINAMDNKRTKTTIAPFFAISGYLSLFNKSTNDKYKSVESIFQTLSDI
jgi:hypothetical protein